MTKEVINAINQNDSSNLLKPKQEALLNKYWKQKIGNIALATIMFIACPGDDIIAFMSTVLPSPPQEINTHTNTNSFAENILGLYYVHNSIKKRKEEMNKKDI
jgi:hypothetical protein